MRQVSKVLLVVPLLTIGAFLLGGCAGSVILLGQPHAVLAANRTEGPAPLTVTFDLSGSSDDNGTIMGFELQFGDESPAATGTDITKAIQHTYTDDGYYTAVLVVTNDRGLTNHAKVHIKVTNPGPTASFSCTLQGRTVTCDACGSVDPAGSAVQSQAVITYEWDFGDGTQAFSTDCTAAHTYSGPGPYTVTLKIFDDDGAMSTSSVEVQQPALPIITEEDFTGDGTLDLRASNGIMWIQVNRDAVVGGVKGFIDAGGIDSEGNFLRHPIFSGGMVDRIVYWETKTFSVEIVENTSQRGVYRVMSVDTGNGKEITKEFTVTLEASREYAWIDYRYTNTGSSSWVYDEYPTHIHDGAFLASVSSAELYDIDAYINGVGVINLPSHHWWRSYAPDPTAPFFVLYRPSSGSAVTFGFKYLWDYPIHQVVAYYTGASPAIEPHLDAMATEFTLNPGASARWKALVAFHSGGYPKGIQIYQGAIE